MRSTFLAVLATLAVAVSACGGGVSASEQAKLNQFKKDPAVQEMQAHLESRHKECFKGLKSFSKEGFKEYMACLAPPKDRVTAKACLNKDMKVNGFPRNKAKVRFHLAWISNCIVKGTK